MPHKLAKLNGVKFEDIQHLLKEHAPEHAEQGLYLEHLLQNADDANEVLFLFRVDDLSRAKQFVKHIHTEARKVDSNVNLPHMTFLYDSEESATK